MPKHTHLTVTRTADGTNRVLLNGEDITASLHSVAINILPRATTAVLTIQESPFTTINVDVDAATTHTSEDTTPKE